MKKYLYICIFLLSHSSTYAQSVGVGLGSFADSFAKGMAQAAQQEQMAAMAKRQRLESRSAYGTHEIERMDNLETYAAVRLDEYLGEIIKENEESKKVKKDLPN